MFFNPSNIGSGLIGGFNSGNLLIRCVNIWMSFVILMHSFINIIELAIWIFFFLYSVNKKNFKKTI